MEEINNTEAKIEIKKTGGSVVLKQFSLSDARDIFELIDRNRGHLSQLGDETAQKYPTLDSVAESIQNPKNPKRLRFAIRNQGGVFMGSVNLTPDNDNPERGEVGYYMGSEFQGKGFATEATKLLSDFAFKELRFKELFAKVHPDNVISQRVLIKAGFQETGSKNGDKLFTLDVGKE